MRRVFLLGSTGSIGTQALDVISRNPDRFTVEGIGGGGANIARLVRQADTFAVPAVAIADAAKEADFRSMWDRIAAPKPCPQLFLGAEAPERLCSCARPEDVVLNGITGSVGLASTLAALRSGATLALANKESLVAGGGLVGAAMRRPGQIVPVDSEHSAIAQALRSGRHNRGLTALCTDGTSEVKRIILTASGGPFRGRKRADLVHVTPAEALNHPTWKMGPTVTVNSSTLMNKALELIEAAYLFDVPADRILPVVHPQSVVHSMVEFTDGSTLAQASPPDMRLPIALGLSWPNRLAQAARGCDWSRAGEWTFEPLDTETFPAVALARSALRHSPLHPAVMNAANEVCVDLFLRGRIGYLQIMETVERVLEKFRGDTVTDLQTVLGSEAWARREAAKIAKG